MLLDCRIRRFRGLDSLHLPNLGRVNIIVGAGNSGKTTVLEALGLLSSGAAVQMSHELLKSRELALSLSPATIRDTLWRPLFRRADTNEPIEITADAKGGEISLRITLSDEPTVGISLGEDQGGEPPSGGGPSLRFSVRDGVSEREGHIQLTTNRMTFHQPEERAILRRATFVSPLAQDAEGSAVSLGRLRRFKRERLVLKSLQAIAPDLVSIQDMSASGKPMIWCDVGLPELLPLPNMGQGMVHLSNFVLGMSKVEDGLALFDEVGTGLHYSCLPQVWKALDVASQQFRAQVFATTHSFECVRAAWKSLSSEDLRVYRLQPDVVDHPVVAYTPEALAGTMENGFEMR